MHFKLVPITIVFTSTIHKKKKLTKLDNIQTNAYNLQYIPTNAASGLWVVLAFPQLIYRLLQQTRTLSLLGRLTYVSHMHTYCSVVYLGVFLGLGMILGSFRARAIWALKEVSDDDLTHIIEGEVKASRLEVPIPVLWLLLDVKQLSLTVE